MHRTVLKAGPQCAGVMFKLMFIVMSVVERRFSEVYVCNSLV